MVESWYFLLRARLSRRVSRLAVGQNRRGCEAGDPARRSVFAELVTEYFEVNGKSKKSIEKELVKKFIGNFGTVKPFRDLKNLVKAMGWL